MDSLLANGWELSDMSFSGKKWGRYVFISYCHDDAGFVFHDLDILIANGANVWCDKEIHDGQHWLERAASRIRDEKCAMALFFITENTLKSEPVQLELQLVKERCKYDPEFTYASVNIPGKTVFEMLKGVQLKEEPFRAFLGAFPKEKIFISRAADNRNDDHIYPLIKMFDNVGAMDMRKCRISPPEIFETREYKSGLEVTKYTGKDTYVTIPAKVSGKRVLSVGIEAFRDNKTIKQIVIPEGVERIDDFAFSGCNRLEMATIPESVQSLGYEAFRDCSMLESIEIPRKVKLIGDYCFYRCHTLKEIKLYSEVPLTLNFAAFSECQAMETLTLPEATEVIGPYVFNNCINLKRITIPAAVRSIGLSAFYSCASLEEVRIRSSVKFENNIWFSRCRNLRRIIFPAGTGVHYGKRRDWAEHREKLCYEVDYPQNIEYKNGYIHWTPSIGATRYIVYLNGNPYKAKNSPFLIPEEEICNHYRISVKACSGQRNVNDSSLSPEIEVEVKPSFETVRLGKDVQLLKYRGKRARVEIPKEVTWIANDVFLNHDEIEEVVFPRNLRIIGSRAFYHCTGLRSLRFPHALRKIENEAFWGTAIKDLTIPGKVEEIGVECFAGCNDLKTLRIESPKMEVGKKAFYRCINLQTVYFPNGFEQLYEGMFRGCTELNDIQLPENLQIIQNGAISYVMRVEHIHIPASVYKIDSEAFSNSFLLREITVDPENPDFFAKDGVLIRKDASLGNSIVHYPADKNDADYVVSDVSAIGKAAFMDAEHLQTVTITGDIREIGQSAFERCPNLEKVVVCGKLENIEKDSFKDCFKLRALHLKCDVPPNIAENPFRNAHKDLVIYVPKKTLENYQRDTKWNSVKELVREEP